MDPHFFIGDPISFYRAPPYTPPPPPPPLPLAQSKQKQKQKMVATLDFEVDIKLFEVDVKNMTEGRGGKEGRGPGSFFFFYVDRVLELWGAYGPPCSSSCGGHVFLSFFNPFF